MTEHCYAVIEALLQMADKLDDDDLEFLQSVENYQEEGEDFSSMQEETILSLERHYL